MEALRRWLYKLPLRLRSLFRKIRVEKELTEELRFHLEKLIEEKVGEGMSPEEARYAALRELGGVEQIKEECRDMRRLNLVEDLVRDLRYGLRMAGKNAGFTAVAAMTIALGIASITVVFSIVNVVIFGHMRYGHPERLALVWAAEPRGDFSNPSEQVYLAWRERARAFEQLAALADTSFDLRGNPPVRLGAAQATANFFRAVEVQPELGRTFTEEEARSGARVLVLAHSVWKNGFGSDPGILGRTVVLSGAPWTVIGVMPASFSFVRNHDLWVPLELGPGRKTEHSSLLVVGRVRSGITMEQANTQMQTLQAQIAREFPAVQASGLTSARVMTLRNFLLGHNVEHMMLVLLGAVGFVLLIACANVASLLLARGATRRREIALLLSLGATRGRVIRQLLSEAGLLALIGSGIGLGLAAGAVKYLATLPVLQAPGAPPIGMDAAVLAFTAGITCLTALVTGLAPALRTSKVQVTGSLRSAAGVGAGRQDRLSPSLVVVEFALSVILLSAAGLLVRSFVNLLRVNPGFNPEGLLTMDVSLSRYKPEAARVFYHQALERVRALPGVEGADLCTTLPLIGWNYGAGFRTEQQPKDTAQRQFANLQVVTEGYFQTTGLPLVQGRAFTTQDTATSLPVVVINRHLAGRLFKNQDPLGSWLLVTSPLDHAEVARQIIGVAADVKDDSLDAPASDDIYLPYDQSPVPWEYVVVRSHARPAALLAGIRAAIAAVDRDQPIEDVATMQDRLDQSRSGARFSTALLSVFAMLALVLAAVGIYGVMAYMASQRTSEFGLRMALGAHPAMLLRLVVRSGMKLALTGAALGMAGALALSRVMSNAVFGVSPRDPWALTLGITIILAAAFLAVLIPALRAARVDPMVALRYE